MQRPLKLLAIPTLTLLAMLALPVWAQVSDEPESDEAKEAAEEAAEDADESVEDDEDLDELYSEEDEDKFIPSEDVAFGQSIPFPTDI